jgi:hypothetical protein
MRHWKYSGGYADQPWIDMQIFTIARGALVRCENEKRDREMIRPK